MTNWKQRALDAEEKVDSLQDEIDSISERAAELKDLLDDRNPDIDGLIQQLMQWAFQGAIPIDDLRNALEQVFPGWSREMERQRYQRYDQRYFQVNPSLIDFSPYFSNIITKVNP